MLLTPAAAEALVLARTPLMPAEDCPLAHAQGRILRAAIHADRDLPPFDRATMDGYALRASAAANGLRRFRCIGTQAAGMMPLALDAPDACVEIATGAALPSGADAVVPYEQTESVTQWVTLSTAPASGENVHRRASDFAVGARIVPTGVRLTGREIAVAASCGLATVRVAMRPTIAVIATGDELVEVDTPVVAAHQIRKSNDYAARAALLASGLAARVDRFHFRDQRSEIESGLGRVLAEYDIVILTGGISRGRFDYVPLALADLGVEKTFQGVAQRPGKPFWFGLSPRRLPVFALPGNPVSTYTCLHRYILPALVRMAGATPAPPEYVALTRSVVFKPALTYFLPVNVSTTPKGRRVAEPAPFNTSGDFGGLVGTDGFVELPCGPLHLPAGTVTRFYPWT